VVFWISKEILPAFGRTAPDFLDWRSDTFDLTHGPDLDAKDLIPFDPALWRGGADNRMPGTARRARIEELKSRIQALPASDDTEIERRRADWLFELGNHLFFLGELEAAADAYRSVARYIEAVRDLENLARVQYQLGMVALVQGDIDQAYRWTENAKEIFQQSEDAVGMARCLQQIGRILIGQGKVGEAAEAIDEALGWAEKAPDVLLVASLQSDLGLLLILTDQPEEAANLIEEALVRFVDIRAPRSRPLRQSRWERTAAK
jgi:tetratricopeptide (TPR) repeat protein